MGAMGVGGRRGSLTGVDGGVYQQAEAHQACQLLRQEYTGLPRQELKIFKEMA